MKYLNEKSIESMGTNWTEVVTEITESITSIKKKEYAQPIKVYLRYNDLKNRIIAMPAYLGGKFPVAGLKWIASFPSNIDRGLKRASSVLVLNQADTGVPYAIINSAKISGIRTAGVTGAVMGAYMKSVALKKTTFKVGVVGLGPIGLLHIELINKLFKDQVTDLYIYDIADARKCTEVEVAPEINLTVCQSFEELFKQSDILITCTVSSERYINYAPQKGRLYLNVSLRDFSPEFLKEIDVNLVDDWDEVCRENTDIEAAHLSFGLGRKDVWELNAFDELFDRSDLHEKSVMFNPMGMAVFDMAVAGYYYRMAENLGYLKDLD